MDPTVVQDSFTLGAGKRCGTCLLILGMHRSGTSALTRALSFLGAELPQNVLGANRSNTAGHWEPQRLVALHDEMLEECGSRWDDWRAFDPSALGAGRLSDYKAKISKLIIEEYGKASFFVIKDPRICRMVPLYEELLAGLGVEARFVLPHRNPLAVAASLAARDEMSKGFAGLIWLRHVLDAEAATRGRQRVFLSYEQYLDDWRGITDRMRIALEVTWPCSVEEAAPEIESHLQRSLQHHAPKLSDLDRDASVAAWVKDTYAALLQLTESEQDDEALMALDRVRAEFEASARVFGQAVFPELSQREGQLSRARWSYEQQISRLNANATAGKERIEELSAELSQATSQIHAGLAEIDTLKARLAAEQDAARTVKRALDDVRQRLAQTTEAVENATRDARSKALRVRTLEEELLTVRTEEQRLRYVLDELYASTSWRLTRPLRAMKRPFIWLRSRPPNRPTSDFAAGEQPGVLPIAAEHPAPKKPVVSVIIPVKNGLPWFERVVEMVAQQDFDDEYEVIVIDSGSKDGSKEVVPAQDLRFRLIEIEPSSFGHGKTRNLGVAAAKGTFCAFLTHDATPADSQWLRELVKPLLEDEKVAAVFGRHIAYEGASPFTTWELDTHFAGLRNWPKVWISDAREYSRSQRLRQIYHFYSDNSSCLRKSVWDRHPYPEVRFGEDQMWAKQIIEAGYRKAFAWNSVVYHSHDYSFWERLQRSYDEACALNELFGYRLCGSKTEVATQAFRTSARDLGLAVRYGWIITHPLTTLARPFDNLARQVGYYLGTNRSNFAKWSLERLSRDRRLQAK